MAPRSNVVNEIALRRLRAQHIAGSTLTRPEQVVASLGAVQAQDYRGGLWAVGLRTSGATEADVEDAIARRRIVRTWPMRGTLHFVAAADARWMVDVLTPRVVSSAAGRFRDLEIDAAVLRRARRVLGKHLEGGRQLARPAVYEVLESAGIATKDQRGIHVLWRLAHDRFLCFGPHEGKQPTFVLFDEWLPNARGLPRDEALATLARRYFTGHGPATARDLAWWAGLSLGDARRATAMAAEHLHEDVVDGASYWSADPGPAPRASASAEHLLPPFDELLVGYADRTAVVAPAHLPRVFRGGMIHPVIVHGGRVLGTWGRRLSPREVACSIAPFAALGPAGSRAVTRALQRYAGFLGLELREP